jgi:hypothetical protein
VEELEKLKKLLHLWMEHNDRDTQIYRDWAEKASSIKKDTLSVVLWRLYYESKKLKEIFEEAIKMIG